MTQSPFHFRDWLDRLFVDGEAVFPCRPVIGSGVSEVVELLHSAFRTRSLDLAGPPIDFHPNTAMRAAQTVAAACWRVVSGEGGPDLELTCEPRSAGEHLSADVTLRFLPAVYRRARAQDRVGPLAGALESILRAWPLTGVLAEGAEYVVPGNHREAANTDQGWINCNLRTQFLKIIRRAGLQPWPRLFHNLRASCETDLMKDHPIHAVTEWIGNTPSIALKHYLQVLESDFAKAVNGGAESGAVVVQKPVQSATASNSREETGSQRTLENRQFGRNLPVPVSSRHDIKMGDEGLEPPTSSL